MRRSLGSIRLVFFNGNLANAVAAQAARLGLKTYILVPADLDRQKFSTRRFMERTLIRIDGNYDHVNRL